MCGFHGRYRSDGIDRIRRSMGCEEKAGDLKKARRPRAARAWVLMGNAEGAEGFAIGGGF